MIYGLALSFLFEIKQWLMISVTSKLRNNVEFDRVIKITVLSFQESIFIHRRKYMTQCFNNHKTLVLPKRSKHRDENWDLFRIMVKVLYIDLKKMMTHKKVGQHNGRLHEPKRLIVHLIVCRKIIRATKFVDVIHS